MAPGGWGAGNERTRDRKGTASRLLKTPSPLGRADTGVRNRPQARFQGPSYVPGSRTHPGKGPHAGTMATLLPGFMPVGVLASASRGFVCLNKVKRGDL